ncbi:MAG: A/G-specific adenine glycosylase [Sulfuricurvum sp.]|uniref:A/G-specific adenine glycosylase n=1 Tax=Sulfuricurvum sp. TaxID=2025608 RepID=UPI00261D878B|nr:A/G-specific adenine glycosylase [Sulfuricurvum sp.]MDD2829313.1 A/G-specific adenine glycosylase [Sulfuricurvum sp.]MDD4948630.1 A/G-specific adenine glycosylase [Sulfuricurvum sp.]
MYEEAHQSLLIWYHQNGRHDLPWRTTDNPYHIYLSEIMLQQTQVKTVLERYYFQFLEKFPTYKDVAQSDIDDILKAWEGLGYYTRARNLHNAARQCNGKLPTTAHDLMQLSGIGRSTAHAIAAFAYREPLPILDANVKRILHRYFALSERNEKKLWEYAYQLFDSTHPFEYNQAMMDLGSLVCTHKQPLCDNCPLENSCQGKSTPLLYPEPKTKQTKPIRYRSIIIYQRDKQYALTQRTNRFLSGLWGFYETSENVTGDFLGSITQHYSHFTLDAKVYLSSDPFEDEFFDWFSLEEITTLSLSRADYKVVEFITKIS